LGFDELVHRARTGATRRELAAAVPVELLDRVCALGDADRVAARLRAYREAGADCVAVVPSTAEDPGGRSTLRAVTTAVSSIREM
jgi:alkanesulfonate monooxygenase SsuD/methylene tetrahydromethanopterin reductase-like flavin-dependent oxidoreductase (luciferase family)